MDLQRFKELFANSMGTVEYVFNACLSAREHSTLTEQLAEIN
jgi:hypothetical protein